MRLLPLMLVTLLGALPLSAAQIAVGLTWIEADAALLDELNVATGEDPVEQVSFATALRILDRGRVTVLASAWVEAQDGFEATYAPPAGSTGPQITFRVRPSLVAGERIDLDGDYSITISSRSPDGKGDATATVRGRPRAVLRPGSAQLLTSGSGAALGTRRVVLVAANLVE